MTTRLSATGWTGLTYGRPGKGWLIAAVALLICSPVCGDGAPATPYCGPSALEYASLQLGVPAFSEDLIQRQQSGERDFSSFYSLAEWARDLGLKPVAKRSSWKSVSRKGAVAILHVGGNHFICVTGESEEASRGQSEISIYDPVNPEKRTISKEELKDIWSGAALFLSRRRENAGLRFDALVKDVGTIDSSDQATATFVFVNLRNDSVRIERAQASCGCASIDYPEGDLAPGQAGRVRIGLALGAQTGEFKQRVILRVAIGDGEKLFPLVVRGYLRGQLYLSHTQLTYDIRPSQETRCLGDLFVLATPPHRVRKSSLGEITSEGPFQDYLEFETSDVAPESAAALRIPEEMRDAKVHVNVQSVEHTMVRVKLLLRPGLPSGRHDGLLKIPVVSDSEESAASQFLARIMINLSD